MESKTLELGKGWYAEVVWDSDVGCVRDNNEDSAGVYWGGPDRGYLLVVADGMGGAAAGEVASQLALETLSNHFLLSFSDGSSRELLNEGIQEANKVIFERAAANTQQKGMGTTCTALIVLNKEVSLAHVGDSRAYMLNGSKLKQLTLDHTLATELEKKGGNRAIPKEAHNILTRCLGISEEVHVDLNPNPIVPQTAQTLLLCSDGLTGMVGDDAIAEVLKADSIEYACGNLVSMAREAGGLDNITVMVVRFYEGTAPTE